MNLTISSYLYDTTQALFDGSVDVKGADALTMTTARTLPEIFERFVRDDQVDVSEFGLTFLLRAREAGEDYVALPIFPNRVFRHSCVFVSTAGGITHRNSSSTGPSVNSASTVRIRGCGPRGS